MHHLHLVVTSVPLAQAALAIETVQRELDNVEGLCATAYGAVGETETIVSQSLPQVIEQIDDRWDTFEKIGDMSTTIILSHIWSGWGGFRRIALMAVKELPTPEDFARFCSTEPALFQGYWWEAAANSCQAVADYAKSGFPAKFNVLEHQFRAGQFDGFGVTHLDMDYSYIYVVFVDVRTE